MQISRTIYREGEVYPVGAREHKDFAYDLELTEFDLEQDGWLKLSCADLMWEKPLTQKQIDFIFDYLKANGYILIARS